MLKILIVEDEAITAIDLSETLKNLGYKVVGTVASAKEAHNIIKNIKPDLILMDVCIKGDVDGTELALEVFERYNIPVVHLTAFSDEETLSKIKKSLSFGYLSKPYNEKELYLAIELAMNKHRVLNNSKSLFMLYSTAIEQMNEPIIISDIESRIQFINKSTRTLLGISPYEYDDYYISQVLDKVKSNDFILKVNDQIKYDYHFTEVDLLDSLGRKKGSMYTCKNLLNV